MSRVTDKSGSYDYFETKCLHCGNKIRYSRKDIRAHRRWPDGFIYCPKCKSPIGHKEEYNVGNRLVDKEKLLQEQDLELRNLANNLNKEEINNIKRKIDAYRIIRLIFLLLGISLMIGGTLLVIIFKDEEEYIPLIAVMMILSGIALIVTRAAVFGTLLTKSKKIIGLKDKR